MTTAMIEGVLMGLSGRARRQEEADRIDDAKKKRQQDDEDRVYTMSERARVTTERERADKLRTDMGTASLPTTVDAAPVAMPIGSRDEPRAPEDVGIRAAGQTFTDPAAATKAAADYNTPAATALRESQVAGATGDPILARQIRTGAMQEQTSKYQLDAAERADIKAKFVAQVQPLSTFEQLEEFASRSGADGAGGAIKVKMVPSADGKSRVVNVILPDGTLKPTEKSFENTPKGFALAKAELEGMPAEKMLAHLHTEAVEARQAAAQKSTETYQQGMLKATQDKTAAGIENAHLRTALAQQKAAGANGGMTLADLKDGHKTVAATLNADWKTQIENETDQTKLKAIKVARESEIATVQRLYTGAMSAGFGLTPEQAIVAFRSGETATQSFKSKDGSGTVKVDGVMYGGRFIPMADNPGAAPGAKPAGEPAAPAAAKTPSPAPAKPASAAPAAPFVPDSNLEAQAQTEAEQMSDAKVNRMKFSPEVKDYLARKKAAGAAADAEANAAGMAARVAKQQALRTARGY